LISTIYLTLQAQNAVYASDHQHERPIRLGARLRLDRSEDPDEQLRVYADPSGHTFCIFLAPA
jgi:Glyoxalase-like domain